MFKRPSASVLLCVLVAACGGGGGSDNSPTPVVGGATADNPAPPSTDTGNPPTQPTAPTAPEPTDPDEPDPAPAPAPAPAPTPSPTPSPAPEPPLPPVAGPGPGPAPAPAPAPAPGPSPTPVRLSALVTVAPEDGATISGIVPLEVRGTGMVRVELLAEIGGNPATYGRFTVSPDGTVAAFGMDTREMPNGPVIPLRILAYDKPDFSPGLISTTAMAGRRWIVRNGVTPKSRTEIRPTDAGCHPSILNFQREYDLTGVFEESVDHGIRWESIIRWPTRGAQISFSWSKALGDPSCTIVYTQGEPQAGNTALFKDLL